MVEEVSYKVVIPLKPLPTIKVPERIEFKPPRIHIEFSNVIVDTEEEFKKIIVEYILTCLGLGGTPRVTQKDDEVKLNCDNPSNPDIIREFFGAIEVIVSPIKGVKPVPVTKEDFEIYGPRVIEEISRKKPELVEKLKEALKHVLTT